MSEPFSPNDIFDREKELEAFDELLAAHEPRVLTITDSSGRGKSALMKLLHHHAYYRRDPTVPATLVEIEEQSRFWLVEQLAQQLSDCGVSLPEFERLNDARRTNDFTPFGGKLTTTQAPRIEVKIVNSTIQDSQVAGAQGYAASPEAWNAGKEDKAREACIDAFLKDLAGASKRQTIAILLDRWEKRSDDVHGWLLNTLRHRVFKNEGDYAGLVFVFAGRKVPVPELKGVLGARFAQSAHCIEPLSDWGDKHVKQWLEHIGAEYLPEEIPMIRARLAKGWTLMQMKQMLYDSPKQ